MKKIIITPNILALAFSIIYFLILFLNISHFKILHGDIFQYIDDAKAYSNLKFPHLIQLQPLIPILMNIFLPLFSNFEFPYFTVAKFFSIFATSGSIFFTYLILKKYINHWFALFVAMLCAIHPLSITVAFDITTVGLYAFFTLAALYFIDKNERLFFLMATLSFFVRIEGLLLLPVHIFYKFFLNHQEESYKFKLDIFLKNNSSAIVFTLIVFIWLVLQTFHNLKYDTPYGNYYLYEMVSRPISAANLTYIFGLIGSFFFPKNFPWYGINFHQLDFFQIFLIFSSIIFLVKILLFKKTMIFGLYLSLLAVIHSLFPAIEYRYYFLFFHLLIIGITILFNESYKKTKKLKIKLELIFLLIALIVLYLFFVMNQFKESFSDYRNMDTELNYDASDWLFNSLGDGNYYVITEEDYLYYGIFINSKKFIDSQKNKEPFTVEKDDNITKIIMNKKKLNFVNLGSIKNECMSNSCLINKINNKNASYIFITNQEIENKVEDFWWNAKGLFLIKNFFLRKECFKGKAFFSWKNLSRKISILDMNCYLNK